MGNIREQWLILISTPFYLIIIGIEILLSHLQHKKTYSVKDTFTNFYRKALITWQQGILYWILLLLFEDMMYYWLHRFDHEIRFFWATHVTHHSSQQMNFTVGFRSSVFQPLYRFFYFIPIAWCGFKPIDIEFIYAATQIWGIFVHTEHIKKMGWLEYIFVTPSHHRVHHGSNPKYLDKNMGMFLIVWDKIFGTFQPELSAGEYQPIQYGLTTNLKNPNAFTIIFHEWNQIVKDVFQKNITLKQRLLYLFGPPGYSHDGSRHTSEQMRKSEKQKT